MLTALLLPAAMLLAAPQQDAQAVLQMVAEKQAARMAGIHDYVIVEKVQGGMEAPFYYEAFTGSAGSTLFRMVPMAEWQKEDPRYQAAGMDPQALAAGMGMALGVLGPTLSGQLMGSPAGQFIDPGAMGEMMAGLDQYLMAAATYDPGDGRPEAIDLAQGAAMFASRAVLQGRHTVFGGREAFLLVAQGLSDLPPQQVGEATFVVDKISVWIDTEEYVQLQLRVAGTMKKDDQSMPIGIELNEWEYEQVGSMYQPRRRLMGISGLMGGSQLDPKQQQKMAKAQADMVKLRQQIAAMPASQRAMIQGQVDKAEAQLALMTTRDVMTAETELMVYSIDRGPPFYWKPTCPSLEGPDAAGAPDFCTQ